MAFLPVRYVVMRTVEAPSQEYTYFLTVDSAEIDGRLANVDADGEISFPNSEPDWVFDPAQWPHHNGEQIPNLAAGAPAPSPSVTPPH
jgi:hypothetical protein